MTRIVAVTAAALLVLGGIAAILAYRTPGERPPALKPPPLKPVAAPPISTRPAGEPAPRYGEKRLAIAFDETSAEIIDELKIEQCYAGQGSWIVVTPLPGNLVTQWIDGKLRCHYVPYPQSHWKRVQQARQAAGYDWDPEGRPFWAPQEVTPPPHAKEHDIYGTGDGAVERRRQPRK